MSRTSLVNFLEKINDEMNRGKASDQWRTKTGNKLTTTITVNIKTITYSISRAVTIATNVIGNGDILIKDLGDKYTALTTALMTTLRTNFNTMAATSAGVEVLKGSRSGNIIRIKLDKIKGSKRDNFREGQKKYEKALQKFYDDFAGLIGDYLTRISTSNKSGIVEQTKQSQVFNLEHIKGKSNVLGFINDTIYDAIQSYDGTLEDLKANAKALGLKTYLNIEKNAKTGEIKVYVGSQAKNVAESKKEQKLKADLQKALKKALEKLKDPLFEVKGSDSLKDAKRKQVLEKTLKPFKRLKHVKVKAPSTKIKESKGPTKLDVSGKVAVGKLAASKLRKKKVSARKSPASSMLQMIGLINKELPQTVRGNMGEPALVNRTGRFASSVRVTDIIQTPRGYPSIGYTYQRKPYGVFEDGEGAAPWANGQRDPRKLIDASIREIAAKMAIGRFYTRRV